MENPIGRDTDKSPDYYPPMGSVALLAGLLTRFTAASMGMLMLGAITMVHLPHGFFMNWFGKQQGEGYEYHLLVIGIAAALLVTTPERARELSLTPLVRYHSGAVTGADPVLTPTGPIPATAKSESRRICWTTLSSTGVPK